MACFCVIISNSLSSYEGCRVASFCEKVYDRQSNNIVFCFFFCCHLPGMCHSLSKHFWQIPVFHCGHLRNSVIQWMRKHSINSWPALWNENSPFDFLPPYFFFFLPQACCLFCTPWVHLLVYFASPLWKKHITCYPFCLPVYYFWRQLSGLVQRIWGEGSE